MYFMVMLCSDIAAIIYYHITRYEVDLSISYFDVFVLETCQTQQKNVLNNAIAYTMGQ